MRRLHNFIRSSRTCLESDKENSTLPSMKHPYKNKLIIICFFHASTKRIDTSHMFFHFSTMLYIVHANYIYLHHVLGHNVQVFFKSLTQSNIGGVCVIPPFDVCGSSALQGCDCNVSQSLRNEIMRAASRSFYIHSS